jgi:hypothetical protein
MGSREGKGKQRNKGLESSLKSESRTKNLDG